MTEYRFIFKGMEDYKIIRQEIKSIFQRYLATEIFFLEVALNEAVNNALEFRCNEKSIVLKIRFTKKRLIIRITDQGKGFNVNEKFEQIKRNSTNYSFLWDESGRGLFIIYQSVDLMKFNKEGNDLLLIKKL
jgi:serine/threonine-protein kinase RsbW